MRRLVIGCNTLVLLLGGLLASGSADDIFPPPWRGQSQTTLAIWDNWGGAPHNMEPDIWLSDPPLDPLEATTNGDAPVWDGSRWVLRLDQEQKANFHMPNYLNDNPFKLARVQVTYANLGNPDQWPVLSVTGPDIEDVFGPWLIDWTGGDYRTVVYGFEIYPNPSLETFHLSFDPFTPAYVDQVVIDTWCVPEPSTLVLLGMGAVGLLAYAWRRRRN